MVVPAVQQDDQPIRDAEVEEQVRVCYALQDLRDTLQVCTIFLSK